MFTGASWWRAAGSQQKRLSSHACVMKRTGSLRRCVSCRKKFRPQPSACATQKVCSALCRRARRQRNGKKRRSLDVNAYREDERARQRALRSRRLEEKRPAREAVSRTSLGAEARVLVGDLLEIWDTTQARSRTSLKRELRRAVGLGMGKRGQKHGKKLDVTDQPFSLNP